MTQSINQSVVSINSELPLLVCSVSSEHSEKGAIDSLNHFCVVL